MGLLKFWCLVRATSSPSRHVRFRKTTVHFTAVRPNTTKADSHRIVNSIAVLSEDRFLLRGEPRTFSDELTRVVGWSAQPDATGFGGDNSQSVKTKLINLVTAVRTLLRSTVLS